MKFLKLTPTLYIDLLEVAALYEEEPEYDIESGHTYYVLLLKSGEKFYVLKNVFDRVVQELGL